MDEPNNKYEQVIASTSFETYSYTPSTRRDGWDLRLQNKISSKNFKTVKKIFVLDCHIDEVLDFVEDKLREPHNDSSVEGVGCGR